MHRMCLRSEQAFTFDVSSLPKIPMQKAKPQAHKQRHTMNSKPLSAYDAVGGMMYFPRMLDKIRLFARGELHADFHANLGVALDGFCCRYLHIDYAALREQTLKGGSDDELLEWCFANGRRLNETEVYIWTCFARKRGWRDDEKITATLAKAKVESGLGHRNDLLTAFDFYDADEGRAPHADLAGK